MLNFESAFNHCPLTGADAAKFKTHTNVFCQTAQQTVGVCRAGRCLPPSQAQARFLSDSLPMFGHRLMAHKVGRLLPLSLDCVNATFQDKITSTCQVLSTLGNLLKYDFCSRACDTATGRDYAVSVGRCVHGQLSSAGASQTGQHLLTSGKTDLPSLGTGYRWRQYQLCRVAEENVNIYV